MSCRHRTRLIAHPAVYRFPNLWIFLCGGPGYPGSISTLLLSPTWKAELCAQLLAESIAAFAHHIDVMWEWDLPNEISTWTRLQRVTAYIFQFIKNIRNRLNSLLSALACLKANEKRFWLAYVQNQLFPSELYALKRGASLARASRLHSLDTSLGEDQLICLSERLTIASLSYSKCHLIILVDHRVVQSITLVNTIFVTRLMVFLGQLFMLISNLLLLFS